MSKRTWIIACALSALVVTGFLMLSIWQGGGKLTEKQQQLDDAQAAAEKTQSELTSLRDQLSSAKSRIEELEKEKELVTQAQQSLEKEMRKALESKDVTISELQGKLTVNILDRILFDSGEAVLKSEGEAILQKLATVLAQYPSRQIHVIGHTDNVPIRASARNRFASNWELSTARATAAVRFLQEKAGVNPMRLGAVGYGEFHPLADNAVAEGRARNRRIAIVVLPEELAATETKPAQAPPATEGPIDP
ncbi:MAG: OmpA family protein [Opitutaceae bacterium]|nr:OmpA family protein [Verrucomicrobiales bacterium]